jgi:putative PEP-CTERM system histidine kinase
MIGFASAAVAFIALTAILLTAWRGSKEGGVLVVATVLSLIWAGISTYQSAQGYASSVILVISELLRDVGWLGFLMLVLAKAQSQSAVRSLLRVVGIAVAIILVAVLLILGYVTLGEQDIPSIIGFDLRIMLFLALPLIGLVLTEQIYRNSPLSARWSIKYLCIGLGGMFAYDFYLYADALLLRGFDEEVWGARGYINAIIVPLIAVSAARNPQWSLDVYVSRSFVFHGASVFGAGVYLVAMAAGGYYIKHFGGEWGGLAQLTFLFGAIVLLISLLFSGQLRARLRVFLSKHFFNYRYDYREEWLRLINALSEDRLDSSLQKTVINAMGKIVESPGGMLWLKAEGGDYRLVESRNMPKTVQANARDDQSLIAFLKERKWVIDLEELESEKESYSGLVLPQWLAEIENAWLIVPLFISTGLAVKGEESDTDSLTELLGFVLLAKPNVRVQVNWEVRDLLLTTGRQCASYLALQSANENLMDARQFDAFNRLSAYVVHDLKNIIAQLALVVSNAERHRDNPAFVDDAFSTVDNATKKMERLLAQLRKGRLQVSDRQKQVDLDALLKIVVKDHEGMLPIPQYSGTGFPVTIMANDDRLAAVMGHLIQNAQEATADSGSVSVSLKKQGDWAVVEIKDTGCGMDAEFIRKSLFRPFNTTKGNAGMGIGVYESREFITSIGGSMEVTSSPGKGTCFTINLRAEPAIDKAAEQQANVTMAT